MNPNQLIEEYNQLSTHEEKAEFEYTLWRHYKGIQNSKKAAKTVTQTLKIKDIQYRTRRAIYRLDADQAKIFWDKLEGEMSFHTIYRIITTAKKRKEPLSEALAIELHKYDSKSYTAKLPNGKQIKKKFPTCLLYTSPSPRDRTRSRMPSSA